MKNFLWGLFWTEIIGAVVLYPSGILGVPLSQLTLGLILKALGFVVLCIAAPLTGLEAFCSD